MKHLHWLGAIALGWLVSANPAGAAENQAYVGAPMFEEAEKAGDLPPVAERLPEVPLVTEMPKIGRHGGEIRTLMSKGFAGTVFLTTDDCKASYDELSARGVEFTEKPFLFRAACRAARLMAPVQ